LRPPGRQGIAGQDQLDPVDLAGGGITQAAISDRQTVCVRHYRQAVDHMKANNHLGKIVVTL
jgi:hypothetical protein